MPLVRYELQNEHKLADSNLVSTASKNDPEEIFDGIAMAGLVGLVRQLGNLAQFAADLFHELHDEIKATAARGHELVSRLQHLEAHLPVAEKALLSETNQLRFTYTTGANWHASICIRENHCSEGGLPQFIQNYYKECRSPPKFPLLDKFGINGAGACQKRYSDPSFFKAKWASSELRKAENVLKDRKARQIKKKRNNKGIGRAESVTSETRPSPRRVRYSYLYSETWGRDISIPGSAVGTKPKMPESYPQISERDALQDQLSNGPCLPPKLRTLREILETDEDFETLRLSAQEIEAASRTARYKGIKPTCDFQQKAEETEKKEFHNEEGTEDTPSEADQFMDAMTTVELETGSDFGDRVEIMLSSASGILCPSEDDSLKQQHNTFVQEMDNQSNDQLDSSVLLMSDLSLSSSPSSGDCEESFVSNNQGQDQNSGLQPTEDFAKDETRVQKREPLILPPKNAIAEIYPEITVHHLLSEPSMDLKHQSADTVHEDLCFSQESEHANYECFRRECTNSPHLSAQKPPQFLANNPCMAELNTDIRPIPLTISADSGYSSSRMSDSPPSNILTDLSGETELDSSNAISSSSSSSPRSPLFSALKSPMSPIRIICISTSSISKIPAATKMIRPSSPTLESNILSPQRIEGVPPTPTPLLSPTWRSKQASHNSFGQSHKIMQAPPTPPPFPPRKLLSNLVQPIHQAKQTTRSTLHGPRHDALIESISAYDRSKLRKVSAAEKQLPKPKTMDEILLEQIRTKSFRLCRTAVQKHDDATVPNPDMTNVAAILEKANAIRQAFAGSDEEDANQAWTEAKG